MSDVPQLPKMIERGRMMPINHVRLDPHRSPQKMASILDKAARHAHTNITAKSTVGKPGAKGKPSKAGKKGGRVTKATGKAIVGTNYNAGGKK